MFNRNAKRLTKIEKDILPGVVDVLRWQVGINVRQVDINASLSRKIDELGERLAPAVPPTAGPVHTNPCPVCDIVDPGYGPPLDDFDWEAKPL
jgi:hypothetical protein